MKKSTSKQTKPATQNNQPTQNMPVVPGIEKQIILSVLIDFVLRCRAAIENSVKANMNAHKDDPEALKDASLYMDGANMMYNLLMQGLLNAPQIRPQPAQQAAPQHVNGTANKTERRAKAQEQHKEVQ